MILSNVDKLKVDQVESKGYGSIYKLPMMDKDLDVVAKAFYAYICSFAGAGDTAFPGMDKICHDLGVSRQRLERHRKTLVKKGYITITQIKEKGKFARNVYKINKEIKPLEDEPMLQNTSSDDVTSDDVTTQNVTINNNIFKNNNINNNNINNNNTLSVSPTKSSKQDNIPYAEIIDYLNKATNKNYRKIESNKKLIRARWKEGYTLTDFFTVIDKKTQEWKNTKMEQYLQPSTLFGSKFDQYLNQGVTNNGTYWTSNAGATETNTSQININERYEEFSKKNAHKFKPIDLEMHDVQ